MIEREREKEVQRINYFFIFIRYCEQRRKVLLDHVHEGYEKDYWEYQEDL